MSSLDRDYVELLRAQAEVLHPTTSNNKPKDDGYDLLRRRVGARKIVLNGGKKPTNLRMIVGGGDGG